MFASYPISTGHEKANAIRQETPIYGRRSCDDTNEFRGAGDYLVTAILPGFETVDFPVSVEAGGHQTLSIVPQVARRLETVSVVAEEPQIFARNVVAEPMMLQQSNITSVMSVVDNPVLSKNTNELNTGAPSRFE